MDGMGIRRGRLCCRMLLGCSFRSRGPRYGAIRGRFLRHAGFSALRCRRAYSGWTCCSGWGRIRSIGAGIVVRGVVSGVGVVDIVGVAAGNFLDRLVFLLQLSYVRFECGLELALGAAKFSDRFSNSIAQFGQLLGTE